MYSEAMVDPRESLSTRKEDVQRAELERAMMITFEPLTWARAIFLKTMGAGRV